MARTIAERSDIIPILAETFRMHGYEGASLSVISEATRLGKGSLYHFFPGGKEEMAAAVLGEIEVWFRHHVFEPLSLGGSANEALRNMFASVDRYFEGGGRVCVVGVFALGDARDRFAESVHRYFSEWIEALASTLARIGHSRGEAKSLAEETVASIQGALILARALGNTHTFKRTLKRLEQRLIKAK
jgi:TetR/AcrR family transcriptional regulator, lmrAB and yxaGH operons repressor